MNCGGLCPIFERRKAVGCLLAQEVERGKKKSWCHGFVFCSHPVYLYNLLFVCCDPIFQPLIACM